MAARLAESFAEDAMAGRDSSHDFAHALRVRNLALILAKEEGLPADSMEIVEIAALLHDVDDHKYTGSNQHKNVEHFLPTIVDPIKGAKILSIIKNMGYKEELSKKDVVEDLELSVVRDADRLDALGAIGIARCFVYGGSKNHAIYDPSVPPMVEGLTKEEYTREGRKTTITNHFHEKLLKLKHLMRTESGKRRAERRHAFMEAYLHKFWVEKTFWYYQLRAASPSCGWSNRLELDS